jgi:hypothetical protein
LRLRAFSAAAFGAALRPGAFLGGRGQAVGDDGDPVGGEARRAQDFGDRRGDGDGLARAAVFQRPRQRADAEIDAPVRDEGRAAERRHRSDGRRVAGVRVDHRALALGVGGQPPGRHRVPLVEEGERADLEALASGLGQERGTGAAVHDVAPAARAQGRREIEQLPLAPAEAALRVDVKER